MGALCGAPIKLTMTRGEKRTLGLSAGLLGHSLPVKAEVVGTFEYTHTFTEEVGPWPISSCDSLFPVLCFDDAEMRVSRWRTAVRPFHLAGTKKEFDAKGSLGYAAPNKIENDPNCGCHDGASPTTIDGLATPKVERAPLVIIAEPIALPPMGDVTADHEDAQAALDEVVQQLADILEPGFQVQKVDPAGAELITGVVRSDGMVIWLNEPPTRRAPNLGIIPWGMASRLRGQITLDRDRVPLLAIGPRVQGAMCEVTILAQMAGEDELREVQRERATVRTHELFTLAYYEANFSELIGDATSGMIELQLRDASDVAIGYPVRELFAIDPLARVREPVHA